MFYTPKGGHKLPHDPFKAIISPRPIGWISSIDKKKNVNLAPYSFFNAIADNPPMVIFSTTGTKNDPKMNKDSLSNILESKEFVVNIVSERLMHSMNTTSGNYPKNVDEFEIANLKKERSRKVEPPRVSDSPASLECKLFKTIRLLGDNNTLVIGEVIGIHILDKYLVNGILDTTTYRPVARMGYKDYAKISEVFSMERPK